IGAGNTAKLCNQVVVALNIAAVSEALVLAKKAGVSPDLVYKAIRGGLAGSTVMDAKAPMMMDRTFDPGFRIELHIKDMNNVLETSRKVGVPLPLASQVMEIMQAIKQDGCDVEDHSSIVKFYEKIANIEVTR
ncbi:MAG: NAD-binding protein, partial [Draconibacterium sp.]|nr:NAD-binding protein [Draconibacterium sp.]